MWLDGLALLVLGLFTGMGVLRGGLATGMSLVSLGVAYAAAIASASRLGPVLAGSLGIPEFLGLPLAGTLAFIAAYLLMGVLTTILRRSEHRRRRGAPRSARDRFLGAVFGAARGGLIVLLLSWLAIWVDALRATGTVEGLPALGDSTAAAVTGSVVEAGVEAAMSESGAAGQFAARVAAQPGAAISGIQELLENPRIEALREDRLFWSYVEHESVDAALNQRSFVGITYDEALRHQLADVGLIDEEAASDAGAFRAAAADVMREVGPRIRNLREDPELQELMRDPEVVAMAQSGDTLALMSHPGFRRLITRVASPPD
jgi:membrane protein required for colicin V production